MSHENESQRLNLALNLSKFEEVLIDAEYNIFYFSKKFAGYELCLEPLFFDNVDVALYKDGSLVIFPKKRFFVVKNETIQVPTQAKKVAVMIRALKYAMKLEQKYKEEFE